MITLRLERAQTGVCLCLTLRVYIFPNGTAFASYWTKNRLKSCSLPLTTSLYSVLQLDLLLHLTVFFL